MQHKDAIKLKKAIRQYEKVVRTNTLLVRTAYSPEERRDLMDEQIVVREALFYMIDRLTAKE